MRLPLLLLLLALPAADAWPRAGGGYGGGGYGGSCFPAGTPVLTLTGEVPIEKIKVGDKVLAYSENGLVQAEVKRFIEKKDRLFRITAKDGVLTATQEHPLLTRYGFTEVRDLKKGDDVGILREGRRAWTKILSIKPAGRAEVFNLEVTPPNTFIAGGFIVHNKGGFGGSYGGSSFGGGYYGRRRYRGGGPMTFYEKILLAIALTALALKGYAKFSGGSGGGPGAPLPSGRRTDPQRISLRSTRTREIMLALSRAERDFDPSTLEQFVRDMFFKVQLAWQAADYGTLGDLMMPALLSEHSAKADAMKARGEANRMDDLQVLGLDFVHVRCPEDAEGRSFTVLITASARDYIVSVRGASQVAPPEPSTFQEYWTFHKLRGGWALARIDQPGELDYLDAPNLPDSPQAAFEYTAAARPPSDHTAFMPPGMRPAAAMTDAGFEQGAELLRSLAPAAAAGAVPAAPAPAPAPELQPPPPPPPPRPGAERWDRQKMEIAATLAFESVYGAWGANDPSRLSSDFVSGEALARLKKLMADRKSEGITFEFRSLFPRRAEIVLTSPAERSRLHIDEFTARIHATAARSLLRNGKPLRREDSPQPFIEYWVFVRQGSSWKLMDILPRMDQGSEDRSKDGAPSPVQIEWYWHS